MVGKGLLAERCSEQWEKRKTRWAGLLLEASHENVMSSHQALFLMHYPKEAIGRPAFLKAPFLYDGEEVCRGTQCC